MLHSSHEIVKDNSSLNRSVSSSRHPNASSSTSTTKSKHKGGGLPSPSVCLYSEEIKGTYVANLIDHIYITLTKMEMDTVLFNYRYIDRLTIKEMAKLYNCKEVEVKGKLYMFWSNLRDCLQYDKEIKTIANQTYRANLLHANFIVDAKMLTKGDFYHVVTHPKLTPINFSFINSAQKMLLRNLVNEAKKMRPVLESTDDLNLASYYQVFLKKMVKVMDEKDRIILTNRLALDGNFLTLKEIGDMPSVNMTRERVRQRAQKGICLLYLAEYLGDIYGPMTYIVQSMITYVYGIEPTGFAIKIQDWIDGQTKIKMEPEGVANILIACGFRDVHIRYSPHIFNQGYDKFN